MRQRAFGYALLVATTGSGVGNVALRDYALAEPVEGAWKQALEAQGHRFPDDVYDLTPLDGDPKAEAWRAANWVVDPVANPAFIADIVPDAARIKLGTWIGAVRALLHTDHTARLKALRVPALVMWATQDGIFLRMPDQTGLLASLDVTVAQCRTSACTSLPQSQCRALAMGQFPLRVYTSERYLRNTGQLTPIEY